MSLKYKLGLLVFFIITLLVSVSYIYDQNQTQLETIATRERLAQKVIGTSEKLALAKTILGSDLPDKTGTISSMVNDVFLINSAINAIVKIEKHPEAIANLKNLQTDLAGISLLLNDLRSRLAGGEELSSEDLLRLDQLDSVMSEVSTVLQEYEHHLQGDVKKIDTQTNLLNNITLIFMVISVIAISLVIFLYILRPINTLTKAAKEYGQGNYEHVIDIPGKDEFGQLGDAFDAMGNEISTLVRTQEQTIADRTRALETSTEVSRRLSTILDADQLVKEVVEQLVTAFNYYYAHIYLFEEDENTLVMKGGTGEAGQVLLARGHTIPKGRGLVGRAAERNEVVLVGDTLNEDGWLPNDLLPDTKSECAVPIAIGDNVLGVFDVQHNIVDGITEADAGLLEGLANQVAIAVQNAKAFTIAQEHAEREARISEISAEIQRATTVDDVMKIALGELGQTFEATRIVGQIGK